MCFSQRKKPACIVGIFSAVIASVAASMVLLSINFAGADVFKAFKDEDDDVNKLKNLLFYILTTFSLLALILGVWGLCLLKCTNRCCPILFGICLLPTWIVTFIFGCIIAWFSNSSASTIQ